MIGEAADILPRIGLWHKRLGHASWLPLGAHTDAGAVKGRSVQDDHFAWIGVTMTREIRSEAL